MTSSDEVMPAKIAQAHLKEISDYYTGLKIAFDQNKIPAPFPQMVVHHPAQN